MNPLLDMQILGWLLVGLGAVQLLPASVALLYGEPAVPYVASACVAVVFGLPLGLSGRTPDRRLRARDGFVVVTGAWLLASLFGALPYLLTDQLQPVDALFESVSGFTTTGATVLSGLDHAPRGLLLWRSLSQWLGGMGIIVFAVAILPLLGIGGMQLFKAEVPGPVASKLTPRISVTARRLWLIYAGFTGAAFAGLWLAGLDAFDAACHAFSTLSTGGFSTRDASVAAFQNAGVEWIVSFFMLLGGINFVLHYQVLAGRAGRAFRDAELRYFLLTIAVASGLLAWLIAADTPDGPLRKAVFQVVSIITTTGLGSVDFERWPELTQLVLVLLMVLGGMAGSTSGGFKSLRALLLVRALRANLHRGIHPHAIQHVKYGGRPVGAEVMNATTAFLVAYILLVAAATAVVATAGYDLVTCVSASVSAVSNIGPGLGEVGPTDNYAHLPGYVKLALAACMVAGRLEIFTVLVLLQRGFWRR